MDIPHVELSPETLNNLVEEFVSREGTDYGDYSYSFADKVSQVILQLERGQAKVVFDPETETINILTIN